MHISRVFLAAVCQPFIQFILSCLIQLRFSNFIT